MATFKKRVNRRDDLPEDIGSETIDTIARIESHPSVVGVLFLKRMMQYFETEPSTRQVLRRSTGKILHICTVPETMSQTMMSKLPVLNYNIHRALTEITVVINGVNPIIDRIMEDDSVEGVVMTNKEGAPILTNISTNRATVYGIALNKLSTMTQNYIKELDLFDEALVTRIHTTKIEIMVAPHPEFNIIVMQQPLRNVKTNKKVNKSIK